VFVDALLQINTPDPVVVLVGHGAGVGLAVGVGVAVGEGLVPPPPPPPLHAAKKSAKNPKLTRPDLSNINVHSGFCADSQVRQRRR
jgi:hypothetical protein